MSLQLLLKPVSPAFLAYNQPLSSAVIKPVKAVQPQVGRMHCQLLDQDALVALLFLRRMMVRIQQWFQTLSLRSVSQVGCHTHSCSCQTADTHHAAINSPPWPKGNLLCPTLCIPPSMLICVRQLSSPSVFASSTCLQSMPAGCAD